MWELPVTDVTAALKRLHEAKDRSYKDSWRRRGELVGIFCNIARKYDRLELSRSEANPDEVESRTDTAADLCIYASKYVTWLIEHDPLAADVIPAATSELWSAVRGHAAVVLVLNQLAVDQSAPPANLIEAFIPIEGSFSELEQILTEQKTTTDAAKARLAWQLAGAALSYLWRLGLDDQVTWDRFTDFAENLDEADHQSR